MFVECIYMFIFMKKIRDVLGSEVMARREGSSNQHPWPHNPQAVDVQQIMNLSVPQSLGWDNNSAHLMGLLCVNDK